jgi:hypothetical protein
MVTVQLSQEVSDFLKWKQIFDSLKPIRDKYNIKEIDVYVNVENPDKIVLFLDAPSVEVVETFFNCNEIKEGMKKGGVTSSTSIKILNRIR